MVQHQGLGARAAIHAGGHATPVADGHIGQRVIHLVAGSQARNRQRLGRDGAGHRLAGGIQRVVGGGGAVAAGDAGDGQARHRHRVGAEHILGVIALGGAAQSGVRVAGNQAAEAVGGCHAAGHRAVIGFGDTGVGNGRGERLGIDGQAIHAGAVAVGRQAVVGRYAAIGAGGECDRTHILVGRGNVAAAAGGAGDAQSFRADEATQGYKARQTGASIVGFAGGQRQRCSRDQHTGVGGGGAARQVVVGDGTTGQAQTSDRHAVGANIFAAEIGQCSGGVHVGGLGGHNARQHRALHATGVGGAVVHLVGNVERGDRHVLYGKRHRCVG